ncbi:MAG TPA: helix-turn-helix transcriptional regulator [Pyrinomonadaceae bacterium]|nr:helix-turn-helix transcriptional regulator [Pyrinomonadaceae bacterium]
MYPQKAQIIAPADPETYPLVEKTERNLDGPALAVVTLSHTPLEQRVYSTMLMALDPAKPETDLFTVRRLIELAADTRLSTIRRGLEGLVAKFSVEREARPNGNGHREHGIVYRVFTPEEVLARRSERGMNSYAKEMESRRSNLSFGRVIQRVAENKNLSRREAQVALCCVEGMTNAEIGLRLMVSEQTVKFHLRHIFIKFGVKRRAELISRLLM